MNYTVKDKTMADMLKSRYAFPAQTKALEITDTMLLSFLDMVSDAVDYERTIFHDFFLFLGDEHQSHPVAIVKGKTTMVIAVAFLTAVADLFDFLGKVGLGHMVRRYVVHTDDNGSQSPVIEGVAPQCFSFMVSFLKDKMSESNIESLKEMRTYVLNGSAVCMWTEEDETADSITKRMLY